MKYFRQESCWPAWQILHELERFFPEGWLPQAVCLTTPLPRACSFRSSQLSAAMQEFISKYEQGAVQHGIYQHQQQILQAAMHTSSHLLLTSSTGSGKSLCFWSWVMHELVAQPEATASVCLPTQALLWGQAARLQELSVDCHYNQAGLAMSGRVWLAGIPIDWTVWKGSQNDPEMVSHERQPVFQRARLRIATIDKVHYSLLRKDIVFFRKMTCLVLDEAHQYKGLFGAQVAYLLKRMAVMKAALGLAPLRVFLASATLSEPIAFAAKLLSVKAETIVHVTDSVKMASTLLTLKEAEQRLRYSEDGLNRVVLFYDQQLGRLPLSSLLNKAPLLSCRALYFSPSKAASRILKQQLGEKWSARSTLIYDADLLAERRRILEGRFRDEHLEPLLLIATNALELGVDIKGMDVCLLPRIPADQAEFLQRIGRVGRRADRPGLVLASLAPTVANEQAKQDLLGLFRPLNQPPRLPLHLPSLKAQSAAVLQQEIRLQQQSATFSKDKYKQALLKYYDLKSVSGGLPGRQEAGDAYRGFRGTASEPKVTLVDQASRSPIAFIEARRLLWEAHPDAIYLDDRGRCWMVTGDSFSARNGQTFFDSSQISEVLVTASKSAGIVTRGIVHHKFRLLEAFPCPEKGPENLVYGWWQGSECVSSYRKLTFAGREAGIEQIHSGPRLSWNFTSWGWRWNFPLPATCEEDLCLREMTELFQVVFCGLIAKVAQVEPRDILVDFSAAKHYLQVIDTDSTSGVAVYLLSEAVAAVFLQCRSLLFKVDKQQEPSGSVLAQAFQSITNRCLAGRFLQEWAELWSVVNFQRKC